MTYEVSVDEDAFWAELMAEIFAALERRLAFEAWADRWWTF